MEKKELLSIPQSALLALCGAYDKHVGEYPDPYLLGKDFFKFYTEEIEKLEEAGCDVNLIEQLASLEHEQWISWSRSICKTEDISEERIEKWEKLWAPYTELTEVLKDQDRNWARKALNLIMSRFLDERSIKEGCLTNQKMFIVSEDTVKEVCDTLKEYIRHIDNDCKDLRFDFKEDMYSDRITEVLVKFEAGLRLPPCRMSAKQHK